jgi:hypothetical protein
MTYQYTDEQILAAAKTAHECNRAFCVAIGDNSQVTWDWAEQWQRDSAINGVKGVINGDGPVESHVTWCNEKYAAGWKYGPVKDAAKKEHPCLVFYNDLSFAQQAKDYVYVTVVRNVLAALRVAEETLPGV